MKSLADLPEKFCLVQIGYCSGLWVLLNIICKPVSSSLYYKIEEEKVGMYRDRLKSVLQLW